MKNGLLITISALFLFMLSTHARAADYEYAFRQNDALLYSVSVDSINLKEYRSIEDQNKVIAVETNVQQKAYTALLTVDSVFANGNYQVALGIYESEVVNARAGFANRLKFNWITGKEKEGVLCKAVIDKSGKIIKYLSVDGPVAVGNGKKKILLERIIVPAVKVAGSGVSAGKEAFTIHPLKGKGLEYKGVDFTYTDGLGLGCIKYEAEAVGSCKVAEDDGDFLMKHSEEVYVREKKTVYWDNSFGIVTCHSYFWEHECRWLTSYAKIREVKRTFILVNIIK